MAKYTLKELSVSKLEYGSGAAACKFDGNVRYVRITDITDEGKLADDIVSPSYSEEKHILHDGDILFARTGATVGKTFLYRETYGKCVYAGFLIRMIPDTNKVLPDYIYYFTKSPRYHNFVAMSMKVVAQPNINAKQYGDLEIDIPSLSEQESVVRRLTKLDVLIALRKEQLAKLDELVKARFVEMFGDPVLNPKGWTTVPFLDMGECKNGMNFHSDDAGVEIHCLGVGDFKERSAIRDVSALPKVSLNAMPTQDYLLQNDDIVFVRSNGNKALVGRCLAVYPNDIPTTFSGFCIRYRRNSDSVCTDYLLRVLKSDSIRKKMAGRGANIQNLNQQILASLSIPVPPLEIQKQFSEFVEQTNKTKLTIQASLDKLKVMKKALMQEYFG